jgi:hypothetical protein
MPRLSCRCCGCLQRPRWRMMHKQFVAMAGAQARPTQNRVHLSWPCDFILHPTDASLARNGVTVMPAAPLNARW